MKYVKRLLYVKLPFVAYATFAFSAAGLVKDATPECFCEDARLPLWLRGRKIGIHATLECFD